jgi:hypothetical protein
MYFTLPVKGVILNLIKYWRIYFFVESRMSFSSTAITISNGQVNPTQMVWGGKTYKVYANNPITHVNIFTNDGSLPTAIDSNTCVCNANWNYPTTVTNGGFLMGPINNGMYSIIAGTPGQGGTYISGFLTLQGYNYGATQNGNALSQVGQTNYLTMNISWIPANQNVYGQPVPTTGWYINIYGNSTASTGTQHCFTNVKISQIC